MTQEAYCVHFPILNPMNHEPRHWSLWPTYFNKYMGCNTEVIEHGLTTMQLISDKISLKALTIFPSNGLQLRISCLFEEEAG